MHDNTRAGAVLSEMGEKTMTDEDDYQLVLVFDRAISTRTPCLLLSVSLSCLYSYCELFDVCRALQV